MSNIHSEQAPGKNKVKTIIVNGRPREVSEHKLSYLEVIDLAFPGAQPAPNIVYTVTYTNPHGRDGSLVEGQNVVVKDEMIFNVARTDQS